MKGLKALLKRTAPARLGKRGGFKCFRTDSRCFKGITKLLSERIFSAVTPPTDRQWRGGAWAGPAGGRRRGSAVDAQVANVINKGGVATLRLAKVAIASLRQYGLKPVVAQRVVTDEGLGVASAADIIAIQDDTMVLIELKCGFSGDRTRPAVSTRGESLFLATPLHKAKDTTANRHLAQLSATLALLCNEVGVLEKAKALGVKTVTAALLYVDATGSELFPMPAWWVRANRGRRILEALAQ